MAIVFPPMRENLLMSFNPVTPLMSEMNTNGMAISCNRRTKTCPHGRTQCCMNNPPSARKATIPTKIPATMPKRIWT